MKTMSAGWPDRITDLRQYAGSLFSLNKQAVW